MKKTIKGFVLGVIITTMLMSTALGAQVKKTIEVIYNSVNITVNDKKVATDNILYEGTTYVPLRAISEMLGKEVGWDKASNTASINDKPAVLSEESMEVYFMNNLLDTSKILEVEFEKINILLDEANENDNWDSDFEESLLLIEKTADDIISYGPIPKRLREAQRLRILGMEEFKKMVNVYIEMIDTKDPALIKIGEDYSDKGVNYINESIEEILQILE